MDYWKAEVLKKRKKHKYYIEALDYTKERIEEIFKETHPEWNIINLEKSAEPPVKIIDDN
jgi:hypothetical protein